MMIKWATNLGYVRRCRRCRLVRLCQHFLGGWGWCDTCHNEDRILAGER